MSNKTNEPAWNDGYILEGLDRTHNLLCNVDEWLYDHPAILKAGMNDKVKEVVETLMEVYQAVGRLDDNTLVVDKDEYRQLCDDVGMLTAQNDKLIEEVKGLGGEWK